MGDSDDDLLTFVKHQTLRLREHPHFDERWLQELIAKDPSLLGLGELVLLGKERAQERAGRLDLLFTDIEQEQRYEVELMLGSTDEAHIIRCIEYWDIERRRYPAYEHYAVLVAEDITTRFLNVLSLFSGTIPLIAIQLNALKVKDAIVLDFVRVLDQRLLRRDDVNETDTPSTDRNYWLQKSNENVLKISDDLLQILNGVSAKKWQLNYTQQYIGLKNGNRSDNFLVFRPKRAALQISVTRGWTDERQAQLNDSKIEARQKNADLIFELQTDTLKDSRNAITSLLTDIVSTL